MQVFKISLILPLLLILLSGCKEKEYVHVGPNWEALNKLEASEKNFKVSGDVADTVKLGEKLEFDVISERDGRLWVVQVDSEDNVNVLIPNDVYEDNAIKANEKLTLPPSGASWELYADEPKGSSIVAFIVTTGNTDIRDVLRSGKDAMSKAIRVTESAGSWGIDKRVVDVKE